MKLTKKYILDNRTAKGSWTQPQLMAIGVAWPPAGGWIDRAVGREITEDQRRLFESKMTIKQYRKNGGRL